MAISYDRNGNYKHSDVCYVCRQISNGHIEYFPAKAKAFKNEYGLDLFVVISDVVGTDGKSVSKAGSITEGMTGMKLCDKADFTDCVAKYGVDKINKIVSDFVENHGWSPRYTRPDEKNSEFFPESNEPKEPKSVLLPPLFIDGNFNQNRKRMRMLFYKTVSSVNATYDLYISASKTADNEYFHAENDKYWLYALVNGWIIPCGVGTERALEDCCCGKEAERQLYGNFEGREKFFKELRAGCTSGSDADEARKVQIQKERALVDSLRQNDSIKAEYLRKRFDESIDNYIKAREGEGNFPDFIGAVFVGEVENCRVLAEQRRKKLNEERAEHRRIAAEKERIEAEEAARQAEEDIKNAEDIFVNGGTITDGRMVCNLADKYGVSIPIKTRGWILNSFAKCVFNGDAMTVSYWKRKNGGSSTKIYDILSEIKTAIKSQNGDVV